MGDDALTPPAPRRTGCLRRSCGCAAAMAVLLLVALVAGWHFLSGWTPGPGAWERLPKDTLFALEANNVETLLKAASEDAGAFSLAGAALRPYRDYFLRRGMPGDQEMPAMLYNMANGLSWIHALFFPNYVLAGARSARAEDAFAIMQPPRWFLWTAGAIAPEGRVDEIQEDGGDRWYIAFRDGFVLLGANREIVEHVLSGWDERPAPFGSSSPAGEGGGSRKAYCLFAARKTAGAANAAAEPSAGAPFLSGGLAGNFAARSDAAPQPASATPAAARCFHALVSPAEGGWDIRLAYAAAGDAAPFADAAEGEGAPGDIHLPAQSDLEVALRLRPETLRRIGERVSATIPPEYGGAWLRNGMLDHAGGLFTLLASRPAKDDADGAAADSGAGGAAPYPPLPVLALGWSIDSAAAPAAFADSLGGFVDRLRANFQRLLPPPARLPQSFLRMETAEDRLSGTLSLPPVFANGARPAWRFLPETSPMTGWLATLPDGIPGESAVLRLAANSLPDPSAGHAAAAVNWDMSRAFIDAAAAVAADRLAQIPPEWLADSPATPDAIRSVLSFARQFFTAYPRGALTADADTERHEARARAFVPFGMDVVLTASE